LSILTKKDSDKTKKFFILLFVVKNISQLTK